MVRKSQGIYEFAEVLNMKQILMFHRDTDNPANKFRKSVTYFGTPYSRESFWDMWLKNKNNF